MGGQHTPGPWFVCKDDPECVTFAPRDTIIGLQPEEFIDANTEGNARLIAAAPELLEALEVIAAGDPDVSNTAIVVGNGASTVLAQVRAAIAKARGAA